MRKRSGYITTIKEVRVDPKNTNCTVVIEDDSVLSAQEIFFTCTPQNTVGKKVMIAVDSQKRKLVEVLDVNNENKILYEYSREKKDAYSETKESLNDVYNILKRGDQDSFQFLGIEVVENNENQLNYLELRADIPTYLQEYWLIDTYSMPLTLKQMGRIEWCYRMYLVIQSGFTDFSMPEAKQSAADEYRKYLNTGKLLTKAERGYRSFDEFLKLVEKSSNYSNSYGDYDSGSGDVYA